MVSRGLSRSCRRYFLHAISTIDGMILRANGRELLKADNELSAGHEVGGSSTCIYEFLQKPAVLRLAFEAHLGMTSATRSCSSRHSVNCTTRRRASSAANQNYKTRPVSKYDGYNVFECLTLPGRRSHVHTCTQPALHLLLLLRH